MRARYGKSLRGTLGWHVVKRLAGAHHEPRDPLVASAADEQLGAAPVAHHERDLAQVQRFDELAKDLRHTPHRQVGVRTHRTAMCAEWQGGQHAAVVAAQICHHVSPKRAVHD